MAKIDGQTVIDRAFDLNSGSAWILDAAGRVWARKAWGRWRLFGGFGKAPAVSLSVRFRVWMNAAPGASVRFGRSYRPPGSSALLAELQAGRAQAPDGCQLADPAARCPHGFRSWPALLGLL